ncbi:MAG TPA: hypothetical protein VF786_04135 [Terriglobales bacterium]
MNIPMHLTPKTWKYTFEQLGFATSRCSNPQCRRTALSNVLRRSESYVLNRNDWFCSPGCLEVVLARRFENLHASDSRAVAPSRMPLGLLLLGRGKIGDQQLRSALAMQGKTGRRIGSCLCSLGATTESDVSSALASQWACPLFPVQNIQSGCASLIPAALLRQHQMLPVHFTAASRSLYVAFARGIDYACLYAVEQMLDCHTEPCVVPDRVIFDNIEKRSLECENERALRLPQAKNEMAHTVVSYARQCGAEEIHYVAMGGDLWARMIGRDGFMDVSFHETGAN